MKLLKNMSPDRKKVAAISAAAVALVGGMIAATVAVADNRENQRTAAPATEVTTTTTVPTEDTITVPVETATPAAPTTTIANRAFAPDGSLITQPPRPKEPEPNEVTVRTPVRCSAGGEPTTGTLPGDSANANKRWVTVSEISGSCDLQGSRFSLSGTDTRLVFRSDASTFNAFVVDAKTGIEGTAGYPHAQCAGPCSDTQFLTDPAGTYNLRVQADGGPWQLLIEEYR